MGVALLRFVGGVYHFFEQLLPVKLVGSLLGPDGDLIYIASVLVNTSGPLQLDTVKMTWHSVLWKQWCQGKLTLRF